MVGPPFDLEPVERLLRVAARLTEPAQPGDRPVASPIVAVRPVVIAVIVPVAVVAVVTTVAVMVVVVTSARR